MGWSIWLRITSITRSTDSWCERKVESRMTGEPMVVYLFSQESVPGCCGSGQDRFGESCKRILKRRRNRSGNQTVTLAAHAGYLLLATGDEFGPRAFTPVFKAHVNTVLRNRAKKHADHHRVEGLQLFQVLARAIERDERKTALKFAENFRNVLPQEHLPRASLPVQVVDVINVAHQAGLFKTHDVAIFVSLHDALPATKPKAKAGPCSPIGA